MTHPTDKSTRSAHEELLPEDFMAAYDNVGGFISGDNPLFWNGYGRTIMEALRRCAATVPPLAEDVRDMRVVEAQVKEVLPRIIAKAREATVPQTDTPGGLCASDGVMPVDEFVHEMKMACANYDPKEWDAVMGKYISQRDKALLAQAAQQAADYKDDSLRLHREKMEVIDANIALRIEAAAESVTAQSAIAELLEVLKMILLTHDLSCKGEECQISGIDAARILIAKHTKAVKLPIKPLEDE